MKFKLWSSVILTGLLAGCDTGASLNDGTEFVSGLDSNLTMQIIYDKPVQNLSYVCEPEQLDETVVIEVQKTNENGFVTCERGDKTVTLFLGESKDVSIEVASFDLVALSNKNVFERNEQKSVINGTSTSVSVLFPINLADNINSNRINEIEPTIYRVFKSLERQDTQNFLVIPNEAHSAVIDEYSGISTSSFVDSIYNQYLSDLNDSLPEGNKLASTSLINSAQAAQQLAEASSSTNAGFYGVQSLLDVEDRALATQETFLSLSGFLTRDAQWRMLGSAFGGSIDLEQFETGSFDVYLDKNFEPQNVVSAGRTQLKNLEFQSAENSSFVAELIQGDFFFNGYVFEAVDYEQNTISCAYILNQLGESRSTAEEYCNRQLRFSDSVGKMTYQDAAINETYRFAAVKSEAVGASINLPSGYSYPIFVTADFIGAKSEEEAVTEVINETVSLIINEAGNVYRDLDANCEITDTDDLVGIVRQIRANTDFPALTFGIIFSDPRQSLYGAFSGFNLGQNSDTLASFALQLNLDTYQVTQPTSTSSDTAASGRWFFIVNNTESITEGRIENSMATPACSN